MDLYIFKSILIKNHHILINLILAHQIQEPDDKRRTRRQKKNPTTKEETDDKRKTRRQQKNYTLKAKDPKQRG